MWKSNILLLSACVLAILAVAFNHFSVALVALVFWGMAVMASEQQQHE